MSTTVEIVKTPDVLHGKPRIEGTRIGVFTIGESVRAAGRSVEDMLTAYPDLTREQVEAALAYYDDHPEAMDILRQQKEATRQRVLSQSRAPGASDDAKHRS
ncbi:DUF433 domain-containing protein [Halococcus sp. AFM35]|uniref:DUF433 domain-containing protein n=1 Tax=Halococcus sp. AFM35 TaxID=3421653 RepID=UPI003EBCFEC5